MASKMKDEGPNLMYNQLRKFISVVVSLRLQKENHLKTNINHRLFQFRTSLEMLDFNNTLTCQELQCLVLRVLVNLLYSSQS